LAGDFTVEGWLQSTNTKNFAGILSFDNYNPALYLRGNGVLQLYPNSGSLDSPEARFNDGQLHHFAAVRVNGSLTYYRDGVPVGTTAAGNILNAQNVSIGTSGYPGENFPGLIDELSFYTRGLSEAASPRPN
jgi:hypothetical protein